MGWFEDTWQNTWGNLWDQISGNTQKQAQRDAIESQQAGLTDATNQQIKALQLQQAQEQQFQQQMLDKQLAAIAQQGQAGTGMSLAQMIAQLQMAGAQQQMAMPQLQAQQAMLSQALPNLLALSGGTPYTVPASVQTIDYNALINQLPAMLNQGNSMAQNLYNQVYGTGQGNWQEVASAQQQGVPLGTMQPTVVDTYQRPGAQDKTNNTASGVNSNQVMAAQTAYNPAYPGAQGYDSPTGQSGNKVIPAVYADGRTTAPGMTVQNQPVQGSQQYVTGQVNPTTGQVGGTGAAGAQVSQQYNGQTPMTTTALTAGPAIDINKLVMGNPEYQLRNQTMNENLNRRLSGLGMQNSSDALYMQGRLSSDLMADAYNKAYDKQLNLYRMAMGESPIAQSANAASQTLGGLSSNVGSALTTAAQNRSNAYANQAKNGSSLAQLTGAIGNLNAQNTAQQGTLGAQWNYANQPASWLDTGMKLYSAFSGFGGGGGNSSDLDWWNAARKK